MKDIVMPIAALKVSSMSRPAGYLEDAIASGRMSDDGFAVIYTQDQYDRLLLKYRGRNPNATNAMPLTRGPGTELSRLLKRFGINPTPTCQCRAKARQMDAWGPDECAKPERIAEVVAVMRAEAKSRGVPFLDIAGRMLIRRAIANARRAAAG